MQPETLRPHPSLSRSAWQVGLSLALVAAGFVSFAVGAASLMDASRGHAASAVLQMALGAILGLTAIVFMRQGHRRRADVSACCEGYEVTSLAVLSDEMGSGSTPIRTLRLARPDDAGPPATITWTVLPRLNGNPRFVSRDPPRVAALRATADRSIVVPITSDGHPFAMPRDLRRSIFAELGPDPSAPGSTPAADVKTDAPGTDAEPTPHVPRNRLPSTERRVFRAARSLVARQALWTAGLGALAVAGALPGLLLDEKVMLECGLWTMTLPFGCLCLYWWWRQFHKVRPLVLSPSGVELSGRGPARHAPWHAVLRVRVSGVRRTSDSLNVARHLLPRMAVVLVLCSVFGMSITKYGGLKLLLAVIAGVIAGAWFVVSRWLDRGDADLPPHADDIDAFLRGLGMGQPGLVPDISVAVLGGLEPIDLPGTHGWDAARALVEEAVARGIAIE